MLHRSLPRRNPHHRQCDHSVKRTRGRRVLRSCAHAGPENSRNKSIGLIGRAPQTLASALRRGHALLCRSRSHSSSGRRCRSALESLPACSKAIPASAKRENPKHSIARPSKNYWITGCGPKQESGAASRRPFNRPELPKIVFLRYAYRGFSRRSQW